MTDLNANLESSSLSPMTDKKKSIEELKSDPEIQEIVEIARLSKASKETSQSYEDKTRPIITSKHYGQEIKVIHYSH